MSVENGYDLDKVLEQMEERTKYYRDCTKYGNANSEQIKKSYDATLNYEVADMVEDLIEIVKKGWEK